MAGARASTRADAGVGAQEQKQEPQQEGDPPPALKVNMRGKGLSRFTVLMTLIVIIRMIFILLIPVKTIYINKPIVLILREVMFMMT